MVKKQAFVVFLTVMSFIGSAFGLGLGDIEVKSNLNDPLEAEIELIQLQGLTAGEILPTLASNDDFRRAGVERSFFLSNIQFRVRENESGDTVVTLTTSQAVREPFLNFLVEVNWPGGRLLKEYTVLLDPPVFDTGLAVDALVIEPTSQPSDLVTTTVVSGNETVETVAPAATVEPRVDALPEGQYRVQRNDTLWEIALRVPGRENYSPQQVMLAIQDLNPEAFLVNNINRVKAGSVLTLPDGRQISTRSLDEAIAEVQAQNRGAAPNLRAPVAEASEVQLSATDSTSSALPSADAEKNPDGYLELTAEAESSSTTASGEAAATVDQLQNQLAVAEELNDQYERERDELESRVAELQEQIAIMERLMDVQNSDLAEVQQALSDDQASGSDSQDTMTGTDADSPSDEVDAGQTETEDASPADQTVTPAPQTQPTVQPQPAPQPTSDGILGFAKDLSQKASDWVLASTVNMAITGGALLLLILVPLYIRSKRSGSEQTLGEINSVEEPVFTEPDELSADFDEDLLADVEDDFEEEVSTDEPEALDAVVEAEMYMAYQKYDQAEEKLKEAFSEHPDRADVGLKLLEVYAETGDSSAFGDLESRLALSPEQQREVQDLRAKLPIGGASESVELTDDLDDFSMDLSGDDGLDLGTSIESSGRSDLDFDLDLDSDTEEPNPVAEPQSKPKQDSNFSLGEPEAEEDLDFSLDLGDLDASEETSDDDGLDFSLEDESVELEAPSASPEPEAESASDLDFSLDLDEGGREVETLELESDLNLDGDLDFSTSEDAGELAVPEVSEDASLELDESGFDLDLGDDGDLNETADEATDLDLTMDAPVEPEGDALSQLADSLDSDADLEDDEFDFLSGNDEASTKLDLARAYIEMDDADGARDILEEVAAEGNEEQKAQAQELMSQL